MRRTVEETLALQSTKLGPDRPDTLMSMKNLADSYAEAGQFDRALNLFGKTLERMRSKLGLDHPWTFEALEGQARCVADSGQLDHALAAWAAPLLRSGYEEMARIAAAIPLVDRPRLAEALDCLIAVGLAAGSNADVEAWKAERAKPGPQGLKP